MRKNSWQPKKDGEFAFPVADGSAKLSGRDYELQEPTLRRESTVRREDLNGESHGDREEFRPEEIKRWRRNQWGFLGSHRSSERISLIVIILNREVQLAERRIISDFTRFIYWAKLHREEIHDAGGGLEKSQNIWGKNQIQFFLILQGKERILHFITTLRKNSFRWKDLKKALHLIFFEGESKHMLSRLAAQRICETNFFKFSKKSGEYGILSSENLERNEYELRMFCPANFEASRVTYGSEDSGDLSLRDACLGKPRSTNKRSFISSNVDSRWKGDDGKGMKGGHKGGT